MKKQFLLLLLPLYLHSQKYDLPLKFRFTRWTYETREQKLYYGNGRLKSIGSFRLYTVYEPRRRLAVPVNRHFFYRRNVLLKKVMTYSEDGVPQNDSIYNRKGDLTRVYIYKKP